MNTQTHVIVGWIASRLLIRAPMRPWTIWLAALVGGVVPDLSMVLMVVIECALGTPMEQIWYQAYFAEPWVSVDAIFNSLPLYAVIGIGGVVLRWPWVMALGLSASLHVLFDLPVHASDAHAHFWPLTNWKFESPFSYWESGKGARVILSAEVVLGLLGCAWLFRHIPSLGWRVLLVLIALLYGAFAVMGLWFAFNGAPWET